jgi:hypothetical protein
MSSTRRGFLTFLVGAGAVAPAVASMVEKMGCEPVAQRLPYALRELPPLQATPTAAVAPVAQEIASLRDRLKGVVWVDELLSYGIHNDMEMVDVTCHGGGIFRRFTPGLRSQDIELEFNYGASAQNILQASFLGGEPVVLALPTGPDRAMIAKMSILQWTPKMSVDNVMTIELVGYVVGGMKFAGDWGKLPKEQMYVG